MNFEKITWQGRYVGEEFPNLHKGTKFGLTRIEAFLLEKKCLTLLNNNFKCICSIARTHFPKIIKCDQNKFKFILTHCGKNITEFHKARGVGRNGRGWRLSKRHEISKQVECIIHNLCLNKIIHHDIVAKNLCLNKDEDNNYNLSLIDFDVATIGEKSANRDMIANLKTMGELL